MASTAVLTAAIGDTPGPRPPTPSTNRAAGRIKHPRAANFVRKFSNGKYLLWYHNHGGQSVLTGKWAYYTNRNPAWVSGGVERNGFIHWSQPEILLYHPDPEIRTSYPDFVEDHGEFYVTEPSRLSARSPDRSGAARGIWNQAENRSVSQPGLAFTFESTKTSSRPAMPKLARFKRRIYDWVWVRLSELSPGQTLLTTRSGNGRGISITTFDRFTYPLTLNDGTHESTWDSDPGVHEGTVRSGCWQHVAFVVDGGPKIITVIVDGVLNDGGPVRDYGWGRFHPEMDDVNGSAELAIAPAMFGEFKLFRIYDRYLRTSEIVGNYRASIGGLVPNAQ